VRAVDDPSLVEELRAAQIPLEVSPTSNLCLGVAPDLASHPFDRLYRAGVALSVNSDDPAFFNTNLTREYLKLHQTFGYSPAELAGLSLAALRQSFLPAQEKSALDERFRQQFNTLGRELFDAPVEAPIS
jgi:adenosine deaminase